MIMNDTVKDALKTWLQEVVAEVYNTGIQKLIPRLQKYIDLDSNYVKKTVGYITNIYTCNHHETAKVHNQHIHILFFLNPCIF